MARQIIWTLSANSERLEILKYWAKRNKSKLYSRKLNRLFISAIQDISKNPLIGRKTDLTNVRVKIVRDYLVFYEFSSTQIFILSIWDGRRDNSTLSFK